jgi:hypothetical protein
LAVALFAVAFLAVDLLAVAFVAVTFLAEDLLAITFLAIMVHPPLCGRPPDIHPSRTLRARSSSKARFGFLRGDGNGRS